MIVTIGRRTFYNTDDSLAASKWVRSEIKDIKTVPGTFQLTNAVGVKTEGDSGWIVPNGIGYFCNDANSVYRNLQFVSLFSWALSCGHSGSLPIIPKNLRKVCALFAARKTIMKTWITDTLEYMAPNTTHEDYEQWNNDAIVYALFNGKSQQSGLRDIEYKGALHNVENQFFFMSNAELKELANTNGNDAVYRDARRFNKDRLVYNILQDLKLSLDAKTVLATARKMVQSTFEFREMMPAVLHLSAWDAGWYQIKAIAKQYRSGELKAFQALYKTFEDRIRTGVYEFGFLKP